MNWYFEKVIVPSLVYGAILFAILLTYSIIKVSIDHKKEAENPLKLKTALTNCFLVVLPFLIVVFTIQSITYNLRVNPFPFNKLIPILSPILDLALFLFAFAILPFKWLKKKYASYGILVEEVVSNETQKKTNALRTLFNKIWA